MKKLLLSMTVLVTLCAACTPPMYIPNTTNTPSLRKQGDIEASLSIGTNGSDLQFGYAITDEWGVMLNGSQGKSEDSDQSDHLTHYFGEVGIGRNFYLDGKDADISTRPMFNAFAGAGFGHTEGEVTFSNLFNADLVYSNQLRGDFVRGFIQPSIGVTSKYVDFFFTPRTSFVYITSLWTSMEADWQQSYVSDQDYLEYLGLMAKKPYNVFIEPTLTLKAGLPYVKAMLQLGGSFATIPNVETTFRQRPIIFILGIQMDVNVLGKGIYRKPSEIKDSP